MTANKKVDKNEGVEIDTRLFLTKEEVYEINLHTERINNTNLMIENMKLKCELFDMHKRVLTDNIEVSLALLKTKEDKRNDIINGVSEHYGLQNRKWGYNPETFEVVLTDDDTKNTQ